MEIQVSGDSSGEDGTDVLLPTGRRAPKMAKAIAITGSMVGIVLVGIVLLRPETMKIKDRATAFGSAAIADVIQKTDSSCSPIRMEGVSSGWGQVKNDAGQGQCQVKNDAG